MRFKRFDTYIKFTKLFQSHSTHYTHTHTYTDLNHNTTVTVSQNDHYTDARPISIEQTLASM